MTEEAMLDVSLIAHPQSLRRLLELASKEPSELSNLRVSATFVDRLLQKDPDDEDIVRQISRYFGVSRRAVDLKAIREFLRTEAFDRWIRPYQSERTGYSQDLRVRLLESLSERDAWAYEILLEEWEFLTTHSWLFAKTRKIYDRVVNAGANALYLTKERLEQAVEAAGEGFQARAGPSFAGQTVSSAARSRRVRATRSVPMIACGRLPSGWPSEEAPLQA